ncbi:MAG: AbrB/MazE/SpoVT family DNA-binding domain-containing protein [Deltaproteobacteria bacterium]|nr:AbrB/MazE/SpoVT family DNA-binding domain-containing protein [Deltaproteobacteria bacterium]
MQKAKVFNSGNNQALQLPKEFQLRGREVYIKKMGNCIVVIPEDDPWRNVEESAARFTDNVFEEGRRQLPLQEREPLD